MTHCYALMQEARQHDRFHPAQDPEALTEAFFPTTTHALALDLSAVTAAFYGLLLESMATRHGTAEVDAISKDFFRRLG